MQQREAMPEGHMPIEACKAEYDAENAPKGCTAEFAQLVHHAEGLRAGELSAGEFIFFAEDVLLNLSEAAAKRLAEVIVANLKA